MGKAQEINRGEDTKQPEETLLEWKEQMEEAATQIDFFLHNGKEGHFVVACVDKSKPTKEAAEPEVNFMNSLEIPMLVVTRSTSQKNVMADSRLNTKGHI